MFFQELIEQHRVYCFITNRVGFAVFISSYQSRINLFHFLSHKAELRDAFGIKFLFVAEGHRFQCEDSFACLVHRLDGVLETLRRNDRSEVPGEIRDYADAARHHYAVDSRDVRIGLRSNLAYANGFGLGGHTSISDVNIVDTGCEIAASSIAYRYV